MTADSVTMLSEKIDGVKSDLVRDVASINGKLDQISAWMLNRPPACPKAGLCVVLEQRVDELCITVARQQVALAKLQQWQSWIMGGMAVLIFALSLFGPSLRAFLHLP
jgi:hypothetical protein